MFYYIEGKITHLEAQLAVLDCGGVGFALYITSNTLSRLGLGEVSKLYVYSNIRDDLFDLYGFYSLNEKRSFEMLLGVSGVGPKAALSILSSSTPESLAMSVISGDEKSLTRAPGVGKKIAQRIILELKDKIAKETKGVALSAGHMPGSADGGGSKLNDAIAALAVLGYGNQEISTALLDIDTENNSIEEILKQALRKMIK